MSLELDNDGPFSDRRAHDPGARAARRRDDAPVWPVLARLPLVDAPGAAPPRTPLPTFAPEPQHGEPALQYIDVPHAAPRRDLHVEPSPGSPPTIALKLPAHPAAPTRHYRIDAGSAPHDAPRPHRPPAGEQPSLSDALFRTHAALAPHMGLLSAATLLLAAGLVFWLAMGPRQKMTPPAERPQFGAGLTQEAPAAHDPSVIVSPTTAADVSLHDDLTIEAPAIEWTIPPRVAEAPAAVEPAAPADEASAEPTDQPGPALTPPAPTTTTPSDSASAAAAYPQTAHPTAEFDNGITPTPELDPYPTTPFPAYSFVDQTPAAGAPAMATAPNGSAQR